MHEGRRALDISKGPLISGNGIFTKAGLQGQVSLTAEAWHSYILACFRCTLEYLDRNNVCHLQLKQSGCFDSENHPFGLISEGAELQKAALGSEIRRDYFCLLLRQEDTVVVFLK